MSLRSFYHRLEDNYFNFLDKLESKGINLYKVVDPLEKKGIPTFAVFCLIIIAAIVLILFSIFGNNVAILEEPASFVFTDSTNNEIKNQELRVIFGDETKIVNTDEYGVALVSGLEKKVYQISLASDEYELEAPLEIDLLEKTSWNLHLKEVVNNLNKKIIFKKNGEVYTSPLTVTEISCSNNSNYKKENVLVENGVLELNDIPSDCGKINTFILNYNTDNIDLEVNDKETVAEINLSDVDDIEYGKVLITAKDMDLGTLLPGIEISLYNLNNIKEQTLITGNNGVVEFEEVPVGRYGVTAYDENYIYGEKTVIDDQIYVDVSQGDRSEVTLNLKKEIVGYIKFKVEDYDTAEKIPNVKVTLHKGQETITEQYTDKDGFVNFGIKQNLGYNITFDHPNYVIENKNNIRKSESINTVRLKMINQETEKGLLINVNDEFSNPVEFANIQLIDGENGAVIKTLVSDVYGQAIVYNLDPSKTYQLKASKREFISEKTPPFMIIEREINEQTIIMNIGEGTYNINVKDEFGEPVSTSVSVYDVYNNSEIQGKRTTTDSEGNTLIRVRADKDVYFVIDNYDTKFITQKYQNQANNILKLNISLPKVSNSSSIEFLGYYNSKGDEVLTSVSPGQSVKARFILNINKQYSKAVAHIRVGKGNECGNTSYLLEQDDIYIQKVRYAGNKAYGSTSYTPCTGESKDLDIKTNRDAKWFNVVIENPMNGSYLLEADLVVLDSAIGTLPLNYRAEFYNGNSILRYPVDTQLKNTLSTSKKQSLYAYTKETQLFTGESNFCTSLLCYNLSIFDEQTNITKNIIDTYTPKANTSYRLFFNLNIGNKSISNPSLKITSGNSVILKNYEIEAVGSTLLKGDEFNGIDLGILGSNDHISGKVYFDVINDLKDNITLNLLSDGEVVFEKNIFIDTEVSKNMNLEIVPRKFVPFVPNDTVISVTDDENNLLKDVRVTIKNETTIDTGKTDIKGIYGFILPAPDLGDSIEIILNKQGYNTYKQKIEITNKLLSSIPAEVLVNLNLSQDYVNNTSVSLINNTALPLAITSLEVEENNKYIDISLRSEDNQINSNQQIELRINTQITEEGLNLQVQKNIDATILATVNSAELSRSWIVRIPITVRLTFGNSLDNLDCLIIDPLSVSLRSTGEETIEYNFDIENKCTVSGNNVSLGNIFAELDWKNESEIGVLSLLIDNKEIILEDGKENEIVSRIDAGDTLDIKLKFKPHDIKSAIRNPTITFTSLKANLTGVDKLEEVLDIKLIINKYSDCIKLPQETIPVLACNIFSGYGNYSQYYGSVLNRYQNPALYNQWNGSYAQNYNVNRFGSALNNYSSGIGYYNQSYNQNNSPFMYQTGAVGGYVGQNLSTLNSSQYPNPFYNNGIGYNNTPFNNYNYQNNYQMLDSQIPGAYGATNYSNRLGCPVRPIYVENNCVESVDIKLDNTYGVNITGNKEFTLDKGQKEEVGVSGAQDMGLFNISAYAKPSSDISTEYSFIQDIPVNVTLPLSFMSSECLQISPRKIDMSGITNFSKHQTVKIMNTCYDQGYRLVEVSFLDLNSISLDGVQFLSIANNLGRVQPIDVELLENPNKPNEHMEVWTLALRRNPDIKTTDFAKEYRKKYLNSGSKVASIISTVRQAFMDVEDQVNFKFMFKVGMQTPNLNTPLVYHNIGMELSDNMQFLLFDDKDNWNLFGKTNKDISIGVNLNTDPDTEITYKREYKDGKWIVWLEIPESALTKDKFKPLDKDTETSLCFIGRVNDFPIQSIENDSYIPVSESQSFMNNDGPVEVSLKLEEQYKGYFFLCFKRPLTQITQEQATVYDLFPEVFDIFSLRDDGSVKPFTKTWIGVDAKLGVEEENIEDNEPTSSGSDEYKLNECIAPSTITSDGYTGEDAYKKYGFNRLLFDWENISSDSCNAGNYYCDQEQLYVSIEKKWKKIDAGNNVKKLGDVYFDLDNSKGIKRASENDFTILDLCSDCKEVTNKLKSEENINNYLNESNNLFSKIPEDYKKLIIIKSKGSNIEEVVKKLSNNKYYKSNNEYFFTLKDYNSQVDISNLTSKTITFYKNMEVYIGDSLNIFFSSMKKYGDLTNTSINNEIMNNTDMFSKYKFKLDTSSKYTTIADPAVYLVSVEKEENDNILKLNISNKNSTEFEENKSYQENIFFYNPINPKYNNNYKAPFVKNLYKDEINYISNWSDIQKGYILQYMVNEPFASFYDSRPVFVNSTNFAVNIFYLQKTEQKTVNSNILHILKDSKNESLSIVKSKDLDFSYKGITLNSNKNTYEIPNKITNYLNLNYPVVKDVIKDINNNNICFNLTKNKEVNFWINPELAKK